MTTKIEQISRNSWRLVVNGSRCEAWREWSRYHSVNWFTARHRGVHYRADTLREIVAKIEANTAPLPDFT